MRNLKLLLLCAAIVGCAAVAVYADNSVLSKVLERYQAEGAASFSAENGEKMWTQKFNSDEEPLIRSCTTCHGTDLSKQGSHAKTGKIIEALAPSANPERFTDEEKIEKWFNRNCKWTLGRECTVQEKGDFLSFLSSK
ncbi:MAG: hypothetical protein CO186_09500 [Zetaproteobacteria bacterium CG_4_9_14_3_um_filter_49_83]|nr:MAG: hypothetical protein AUJ56_12970 [Zetaproteobacteria bacterium CG1_02_49_23]PIQ30914.1 MAG: hypothetical protein COW62_11085 [Zetaproteobacteria bacterium CG17_big_fil_post_rev_8_21_14_2_50_50_13]PIV30841.1 MAG: hypothetical protein COS35_04515 [Zetaproteobacteria bacterium CG02_land_8_20_14_3_00_50_9]PIY56233.1 MAG: hypothetical protein COZ00_05350 [Zetaproteobacteria bacterium CG_4_10_14_0_8_um_filter_49_80]PJA34716.1 MAG: hypothetical protein CO186_09500 [Zetaproteobacteria bacterium